MICYNSTTKTYEKNGALLPSDIIDFVMLSAQTLLLGNSFIVRCQDTSMTVHAVGGNFQPSIMIHSKLFESLFQVTAIDRDAGDNGVVKYSITTSSTPFQINQNTGVITASREIR